MTTLSLDTALNLLWTAICLAGLAALLVRERSGEVAAGTRRQRLCAVLLAAICLFPAVSYSDDLLVLSLLHSPVRTRGGVGTPGDDPDEHSPQHLARTLQSIENAQIESVTTILIGDGFTTIGSVLPPAARSGVTTCRAGRAPPLA